MRSIVKQFLQKTRQIFYIIFYKLFCLFFKQEQNCVLFLSASRPSLTGNFEYVYNEIKKRKKYEVNIMLKSNLNSKYTLRQKIDLIYLITISKYIL